VSTPPNPGPSPSVEPGPVPDLGRQQPALESVLSSMAIGWAAAVLIVIAVVAVGLLLWFFGGSDDQDLHEAQLDAIKTAGTLVIGTGGAAALWLTARRPSTVAQVRPVSELDVRGGKPETVV
jgi:hypothetical protein